MKRLLSIKGLFLFVVFIVLTCFWITAEYGTHKVDTKKIDFDKCTSIIVGRLASIDGSTMTSHTCDSNTDRTWINIVPHKKHKPEDMCKVYIETVRTKGPDDPDKFEIGEIPQVPETYGYINTSYAVMNEHQLAIGETTFVGKKELKSDEGLINCPELYRLILERAKTAREAIKIADELTKKYGYIDYGECFTFADPKETWHFEILGPGKGKVGAVWAAQRIPDDHVGVSANASRIRQINLSDPENFMASENVFSLAEEMGWWESKSGKPFEFCYAYDSRYSIYCLRREWRVLSTVAPSLKLNPNAENYPFSVKPEKRLSAKEVLNIFRDTYQGTNYDMTRNIYTVDKEGKAVISPIATPFMNSELRELLRVNYERTIACSRATYVHVTQSRDWLPNMIGGVVWLGYDNPAATPHTPFYCGITQMPKSYMIDGRREYSHDCAWWAFRRVSKLAQFRWQEMSKDIEKVWKPIEDKAFADQEKIEEKALRLYKENPEKCREFLTKYCNDLANESVEAYWKLGDELWVKYSNKF